MGYRVDKTCLNKTLEFNHDMLILKDSNMKGEERASRGTSQPLPIADFPNREEGPQGRTSLARVGMVHHPSAGVRFGVPGDQRRRCRCGFLLLDTPDR